ncbi:outer membrane protein assembly factor BamB family protein [Halobacterium jilantaiense]|uniref:PQQ-like domain-containing protein n=1 Tax=Halobacterium jilantaiense TaxID=355548 RepID=A0A1I0PTY6_9EURY|nr:PQQ-binding-like beta-propeller repeat protein [Halobacterium jilantaiense]SEW17888.1 PQQ-like domain-containing protein [Halobacterium jilantaiense]
MGSRRCSRRALLTSVGAAAATAAAGCTAPTKTTQSTTRSRSSESDSDAPDPDLSLSGDDRWATYGYDGGHTGYNPDASSVGDTAVSVWESGVDGIYTLREPAVADGRLFVGSKQTMWAFDAATGEDEWKTYLGGMAHHFAPTHRDGTLYTVSKQGAGVDTGASGAVQALSASSGGKLWSTSVPATSTVAHDGSRLYVAAKENGAGYVRALDPESGDRGWRFDVPDADRSSVTGTPAHADGVVYVTATLTGGDGSTSGRLYALDASDGSVAWSVGTPGALDVAPVVTGDRVFAAARDGTVHAFTLAGDTAWTADTGASIYSRPTHADDRLFVVTVGDVVALDAGGEEAWRAGSERTQMTGATVADDTLYVGGEPLFALDTATGDVRFDLPVDEYHGAYGAPVAAGDALFVGVCIKDQMGARYDNYVRAYT